jgi:hypothetical protein
MRVNWIFAWLTAFVIVHGPVFQLSSDWRTGDDLPSGAEAWQLDREFALGVREPMPVQANPEPVLHGIKARGFFVGRERSNPLGTSQ